MAEQQLFCPRCEKPHRWKDCPDFKRWKSWCCRKNYVGELRQAEKDGFCAAVAIIRTPKWDILFAEEEREGKTKFNLFGGKREYLPLLGRPETPKETFKRELLEEMCDRNGNSLIHLNLLRRMFSPQEEKDELFEPEVMWYAASKQVVLSMQVEEANFTLLRNETKLSEVLGWGWFSLEQLCTLAETQQLEKYFHPFVIPIITYLLRTGKEEEIKGEKRGKDVKEEKRGGDIKEKKREEDVKGGKEEKEKGE